ncbi:hypothetical protein [Lentzea nigeriaca]|uniref:hypothetical protein n=1 Tax=Lentzea nigeriaca TaxID=1128665 RepID=UPI0019562361
MLDSLAARPAEQRADVLGALLCRPGGDPGCLGSEVFADEVVAAVAVIVAGLPRVPAGRSGVGRPGDGAASLGGAAGRLRRRQRGPSTVRSSSRPVTPSTP